MRRLAAFAGLWLVGVAACAPAARAAQPPNLEIPYGYLNASGGFYWQPTGPCCGWRFAAAGGCSVPMDYGSVVREVASGATSEVPSLSWYVGDVPTCFGAMPVCRDCQPPPGETPEPAWEEVGPGLPLEQP